MSKAPEYKWTSEQTIKPSGINDYMGKYPREDWKATVVYQFTAPGVQELNSDVLWHVSYSAGIKAAEVFRKGFEIEGSTPAQWQEYVNSKAKEPIAIGNLIPKRRTAAKDKPVKLSRRQQLELAQLMIDNGVTIEQLKAAAAGKPLAKIVKD